MKPIITANASIDSILALYVNDLGNDYDTYRNHLLRVYNYCLLVEDLNPEEEHILSVALVFHDLGIWTNNTFNYLSPSVEMAKIYCKENQLADKEEEIISMIENHHKISSYTGKHQKLIELLRRADLVDLSFGLVNFGLKRSTIRQIYRVFKGNGFHLFLAKLFFKNLVQHPLKPLPMFKR